tara:strand:+ start:14041 stop:15351 length:1311 start_codon:yes stop_codon:yes gene_type:complete
MSSGRFLEIACANAPSDKLMSFRAGVSELVYEIPEMDSMLVPTSIRMCGKLRCYGAYDKSVGLGATQMNINERLGVYGFMNTITARSLRHQTTIEQVRNFNRFMSSYISLTSSVQDLTGHQSQSALTSSNYLEQKTNLADQGADTSIAFSAPLPTGLLTSGLIPLSSKFGIGGLQLSVQLESDSQFFYSTGGTVNAETWYEIENPHLVMEVRDPSPDQLSQLMKQTSGSISFQSISSYYDTLASSSPSINFNLGLSRVRSALVNFIRSDRLSNMSFDGLATLMPTLSTNVIANITEVSWLKGGTMYPKHYPIIANVRDTSITQVCDPEIVRDYINSVVPYINNRASAISVANANRDWMTAHAGASMDSTKIPDGGLTWGLGVNYDSLGGSGSDFTQENWGLTLKMDGSDGDTTSAFIFVNSEQTLVYNPNGVQVVK